MKSRIFILYIKGLFLDKKRIDTDAEQCIYSHRMWVVEPVFGNITIHKRLNRFSLRGKVKVNAQVKNLEKVF